MNKDLQAIVEYRLGQADEAPSSAVADRDAGRLAGAISRGYYAMFYAALALLASRQVGTSKHAGVIAKLSELFIKRGPLPPHLGRALNQAFDLRQKADYREFFHPTLEQVDQVITSAREFISQSRHLLAGSQG